METTPFPNTQTKGKDCGISAPVPSPAASILGEHDLSSDTSRELICLFEGEPSAFYVTALGNMEIGYLKTLIHEDVYREPKRTILAMDLVLLKVSYILEQ